MPKENYEVSSESAIRHWEVPVARLENITPVRTEAAALVSRIPGTQLTGTVLVVDGDIAVIDFTHSMVYLHDVRNVRTYYQGSAATWGAINIGDPIFYDRSATMPALVYLSTSPLDEDGNDNPLFGFRVIPHDETDIAAKGSASAATVEIAVMQVVGD